ncbi:P-loop containing nucleoside triphosphate hydrolase protein [Biscogniauxia mediterranea]|nr:P-loop containing nucleoside triphosphate hydrolase protein [Biscogniauxia mediterranea]
MSSTPRGGGYAARARGYGRPSRGQNPNYRSNRLDKLFYETIEGRWQIHSWTNAQMFLESIANRTDKSDCIERLVSSKAGQTALHKSLTFVNSPKSMNTTVANLLAFFGDPALKRVCNGELLNQILLVMVDPPTFWNTLVQYAKNKQLGDKAMEGFMWFLLQLVILPPSQSTTFRETAQSLLKDESIATQYSPTVKGLVQKIKVLVKSSSAKMNPNLINDLGPGGRHDNDFVNYHDISILPTRAELRSTSTPFYLQASTVFGGERETRAIDHLDNQFRLLREDMLGEMREELTNVISGRKRRGRRNMMIEKLTLEELDLDAMHADRPCAMVLKCAHDILPNMSDRSVDDRKKALKKTPNFLRHQSFGCLIKDGDVLAFAVLHRDEDKLALKPPQLCLLVVSGPESLRQVLFALHEGTLDYLLLSTPIYAYEPILERLQRKTDIELDHDILNLSDIPVPSPIQPSDTIQDLRKCMMGQANLRTVLPTSKPINLDQSQIEALIHGLQYQTSQIQGPPGTGKSLVGALLAKALLDKTNETILVLSYTNHALDQFLEDLMDIGIEPDVMVRLGSKSTIRTAQLLLSSQNTDIRYRTKTRYELINSKRDTLRELSQQIEFDFDEYRQNVIPLIELLDYLEFSRSERHFHDALSVPEEDEGEFRVGRRGARMHPDYLFARWARGENAGAFAEEKSSILCDDVWQMRKADRISKIEEWRKSIYQEKLETLVKKITEFNKVQKELQSLQKEKTEQVLQSKRIIGCTTTAASMYASEIQSATPGVIIVEEAGEILESHILAAMGPTTKQLIQIGDHKQLRPKVKNYKLTVEANRGYDLNRSLFERLILQGRPHCTLLNQHRMRPEISRLIRHNYPDLKDASNTMNRPHLLGFQHDLVFFDHKEPEVLHDVLVDRLDQGAGSSKQNVFEADMVLKCIRHLGLQNYKTTNIVVLTPYLGQLYLLQHMLQLQQDLDPVLNDLDSHDLVMAGILPKASADVNKRHIRLSTIDNYQGEESDIVVVSLTRSNDDGDIGFMAAPERLNVLVSRARDALIIIGNSDTFLKAKKGREEWTRFFQHLKTEGRIHDGFPLKCEKHPDRTVIVRNAIDFDIHAPDGGCALPCTETLSCGKHTCSKRCHIRVDHSMMPCEAVLSDFCPQNHKVTWSCADKQRPACQECRREKEEQIKKARRDKDLEVARQSKQLAYAKQLQAIQDQIAAKRQSIKDRQEERLREQTLQRYKQELEQVTKEDQNQSATAISSPSTKTPKKKQPGVEGQPKDKQSSNCNAGPPQSNTGEQTVDQASGSMPECGDDSEELDAHNTSDDIPASKKASPAEEDWQHQKEYEGASNDSLDTLMNMIGLESVKKQFLNIKTKVDTTIRQNTDLKDERFGAALLGNPGTGKTTVARLYAKFLSSVGAIPGDHFEETTGSKLAHDGVQGCKDLIDQILQKGGGVFFLDEAYQIVSGASFGGKQVLDFLLAEIENLTGKVVFVFAGYRKQMEAFFAHNPGIPSRIPIELCFEDYEDDELLKIMNYQLGKKFGKNMKVEGGSYGLYMRIVARRIGRGRGREGFGNAREVQNVLQVICDRQADRLHRERRQGKNPDDFLLRKIDLIGPEPSRAITKNKDWLELQSLIGLKSVKQSVQALLYRLQTNYERELAEKPLIECSLNKVFVGNPGTGKTTVGKLYGKILAALGLLSNGEVVIKNPADFVGGALGQSEKNTKAILDATKGKVLIIDEAYGLAGGSGVGAVSDPYKVAVVDTIVAEVQSTALEDRCVLLLGYKEQMEDMFKNVNPGLSRRFPISAGFEFEDFDDDELRKILDLKLKKQGFKAGEAAKNVVLDVLRRERNRPNFGNAGAVDIILDQAKERQQKRLSEFPNSKNVDFLDPRDIDPDFDRGEHAATNIHMLFKGVIGCEDIIEQLEGYQQVVKNMKGMGSSDPEIRAQIPFSFLFRGPPGTGKTSTARKIGKIYYDMGFLTEATVVECSATDIIGQFVGHTGPKVQDKFKEALGRVLFIDEAYRLSGDHFAKEAMDEIVDCLTKEKYQFKLVVILAGYDNDINRLMNQNPGLTSRFPETISFYNLPAHNCRDLLMQCLSQKKLDISELEASPTLDSKLLDLFGTLSRTDSWGNARDVQTLAKSVFSRIMKAKTDKPNKTVPEALVLEVINAMIKERTDRQQSRLPTSLGPPIQQQQQQQQHAFQQPPRTETSTTTTTTQETAPPPPPPAPEQTVVQQAPDEQTQDATSPPPHPVRDAGVSDAVWEQLQRDKAAEAQRRRALARARQQAAALERQVREQAALAAADADAARREELRRLEAARDAAVRARLEQEERARREQAVKEALARSGRCPVGFAWIPQGDGGYRCAGGSHYVAAAELKGAL